MRGGRGIDFEKMYAKKVASRPRHNPINQPSRAGIAVTVSRHNPNIEPSRLMNIQFYGLAGSKSQ